MTTSDAVFVLSIALLTVIVSTIIVGAAADEFRVKKVKAIDTATRQEQQRLRMLEVAAIVEERRRKATMVEIVGTYNSDHAAMDIFSAMARGQPVSMDDAANVDAIEVQR